MKSLSDSKVERLRSLAANPDFSTTKYTIVKELARGGMGIVYEAQHLDLGRTVALKVLSRDKAAFGRRFRSEARAIARLDHENLVKLHDFGVTEDGRAYYAMEMLEGETLDWQLDRERDFTTRLKRFVLEGLTTEERVKRNLQEMHAALHKHGNVAYVMRNVMPHYVKKEAVILMWGEFAAVLRECDPDVDVIALLVSWAGKKERELLRRGPDDDWSGGPASNAPARISNSISSLVGPTRR